MRWKSRKPEIGDIRIITQFLLFPKRINREIRWLEKATWKESYRYKNSILSQKGWYAWCWE